MNTDLANSTLQNVLAACKKAPNSVSVDTLLLRQRPNTTIYNRLLIITGLLLLLTLSSPLGIIPAANALEPYFGVRPITLVEDYVSENRLYLLVSGDNILYKEAYLEKADGTILPVESYDASEGMLCFPYISDMESNIYIPVKDGTPLHLLLTPQ